LSIYADSSFVVSLYLTDQHSADSRQRITSAPRLWFTPLHDAEWAHAVSQHVFRGKLSAIEAQQLHERLESDKSAGHWLSVAMPERAFALCADLARRHGSKLGVRTLDSLHVACALEFRAARFWTFDERQAKLARAEGLKTS